MSFPSTFDRFRPPIHTSPHLTSSPIRHGSPITEPNVDPRWVFLPRLTVLDLQSDAPHLTSLRSTHITSPHRTPPPIHTQVRSDLSILYIYTYIYLYIYLFIYLIIYFFYLIFLIIHFLFKLCIIHGCLRGSMCRTWYCDFAVMEPLFCVEFCCDVEE